MIMDPNRTDEHLQAISLQKLRSQIEAEAVFTPLEPANEASPEAESDESEGVDELLMSMSAEELGAFFEAGLQIDALTLEQKAKLTGLPPATISKIETNKWSATLEELITYCRNLRIPVRAFIPELFDGEAG